MKFAFVMVFAVLMSFAVPNSCKASVPEKEHDVGFVIGNCENTVASSILNFDFSPGVHADQTIGIAHTGVFKGAFTLSREAVLQKFKPFKYWEDGNTKARLYALSIYSSIDIKTPTIIACSFGRDIRRLCYGEKE